MTKLTGKSNLSQNHEASIDSQFAEFEKVVEEFGLSTFVAFAMHKHFDHTDVDALNDSDKEILIVECQPLVLEAISKDRSLQ